MPRVRPLVAALVLTVLASSPAFADATVFVGANTTPANRPVRGLAVGIGLLVVGFEFEFADTPDDLTASAPALRTGSGNILVQTPVAFFGIQPYITGGAGLYRETLGTHEDTSVALNTGGGVKVSLVGPLRLRIDYRVFKLGSGALASPTHRVYAGLNLKF